MIGLGSWGTAVSCLVARHAEQVVGWVYEREVDEVVIENHRNQL